MSALILSFKTGRVISPNELSSHDLESRYFVPDRFNDPIAHWKHQIKRIEARYGSKMPIQGCVFKQSLKGMIFDTYGYGNVHNSIHQYRGGKYWNAPMPMPANLEAIFSYLKKRGGKVLRLGSKSDPFMWMDIKYQITKSVIEIATANNVTLVIHTMSDLCAHDDYIDLLKRGGHSIVMHRGFKQYKFRTEYIERVVSPGAPSLKRRDMAFQKLKDNGVDVSDEYTDISSLTMAQIKRFENAVGRTIEAVSRE